MAASMTILARLSPYVRLAHDYHPPPGFALPRRRINDHALLYFRQGTGCFVIGGVSHAIAPGTVFLVRPDAVHSFTCADSPVQMLNLHFDPVQKSGCEKIRYTRPFAAPNPRRQIETLSTDPHASDYLPARMPVVATASYERLFHVILHAFSLRDAADELALKGGVIELLALLFRQARAQSVSPRLARHLPKLERAGQFMAANLDRPLTLADMARAAALSRTHFAASFRAYHHQSPARFHLRQRLEKAATELIVGPRSIKEVAAAYGFQTVHHFSRCFARQMGLPPAAYRAVHGMVVDE
jgi:AraC-like DNA-binding protein